ncbi:MAG: alpha/beta hydrolase [Chlorobi bacterium]|nr:alpha/beta hydrolase [Chlorobiota bacterium]
MNPKKLILFLFLLCLFENCFSQQTKKTIYLIPGQGSDYRIYKYFKFQEYDTVHIHYIIPDKNETMKSYAHQLAKQIDTSGTYSIIGVSLGGMIAVEMSEFLHPEKVIIISSAENRNELPFRYRFMKTIPLNKMFGGNFLRSVAPLVQIIVEPDSKKERKTCKSMLQNKNSIFMKRSVNMIINWNRTDNNTKIIHIHGNKDHTIPLKNVKNVNYVVKNGSHMMTLTKGKLLQNIIVSYLKY